MSTPITDKQEQVRGLLVDEGLSVKDAAKRLRVSNSMIYQAINQLREAGIDIPRGKAGRPASNGTTVVKAASTNGTLSVEDHVERELGEIQTRASEVKEQIAQLESEAGELSLREGILVKAKKLFAPAEEKIGA